MRPRRRRRAPGPVRLGRCPRLRSVSSWPGPSRRSRSVRPRGHRSAVAATERWSARWSTARRCPRRPDRCDIHGTRLSGLRARRRRRAVQLTAEPGSAPAERQPASLPARSSPATLRSRSRRGAGAGPVRADHPGDAPLDWSGAAATRPVNAPSAPPKGHPAPVVRQAPARPAAPATSGPATESNGERRRGPGRSRQFGRPSRTGRRLGRRRPVSRDGGSAGGGPTAGPSATGRARQPSRAGPGPARARRGPASPRASRRRISGPRRSRIPRLEPEGLSRTAAKVW